MIKSALLLLALAALVVGEGDFTVETHVVHTSEISKFLSKGVSLRNTVSMFEGTITGQCIKLAEDGDFVTGTPGMTTLRDVTFFRVGSTVSAVMANQFGGQVDPFILRGAIGTNTVTVRYTSLPSEGFSYFFDLWGRI